MENKRRRQVTTLEFQDELREVEKTVLTLQTTKQARLERIITAVVSVILISLVVMFAGCSVMKDVMDRATKSLPEMYELLCGDDSYLKLMCDGDGSTSCVRAGVVCDWLPEGTVLFRTTRGLTAFGEGEYGDMFEPNRELTKAEVKELQAIKRKLEGGE